MLKEKFMSAASACAVVAGITALDDSVHQYVASVLGGDPLSNLSQLGGGTLRFANVMPNTLAFYAADHMLLAFFGLGALVLVGLMLRT
ncbi:MAG: hypothetical protein ACRD3C_20460 [Vicinamibacterales bacterium]